MRAMSSDFYSNDPTDSILGVLEQFASLRSYASAAPGVSGYRVLSQRRSPKRRMTARALSPTTSAALAALARARLRLTGFLSVLFVGGLGLAVLAGPASCPACSDSSRSAERSSASRLQYAENSRFASTGGDATRAVELPQLAASMQLEPDVIPAGVSPITTSALEPSRKAAAAELDHPKGSVVGRLPAEIVAVSDAGPSVQLAALSSPVGDMTAVLPAVEVATPTAKVTALDTRTSTETKSRASRRRVIRAYRTPFAKAVKHSTLGEPQLVQRAPRWAQQMYVSPWQTQAFSYTR